MRRAMLLDAREERLLHVEPFDDGLENPVAGRDARQVVVEAAGANQRRPVGREERIRFERPRAREAVARRIRGDVEQQNGHTRIGKVRGDLRAHRPGAEHGDAADARAHLALLLPRPPTKRSTMASASAASEYFRRLRIQLVAISSSAPKNSLAASVGLIAGWNTPRA